MGSCRLFENGYWSSWKRERKLVLLDDHLLQASVSIMIKKRFYSDKEIYRSNRLLLAFSRLTLIHCNVITSFRILKIQTNKKQPVNFNALKIPKKIPNFLTFSTVGSSPKNLGQKWQVRVKIEEPFCLLLDNKKRRSFPFQQTAIYHRKTFFPKSCLKQENNLPSRHIL